MSQISHDIDPLETEEWVDSILAIIEFAFLLRKADSKSEGIATTKPNSVVISASEMPGATIARVA